MRDGGFADDQRNWFLHYRHVFKREASDLGLLCPSAGEDAMTGDTDKYLGPQDLKELGDDSLPAEGYMGFSLGARSARYFIVAVWFFICNLKQPCHKPKSFSFSPLSPNVLLG